MLRPQIGLLGAWMWIAGSGCGSGPAPRSEGPALQVASTPRSPAADLPPPCAWAVAGEERALSPEDVDVINYGAHVSGDRLLVTYQLQAGDRRQVVRGRLFDAHGMAVGEELPISGLDGIHTTPAVIDGGGRFFVFWTNQLSIAGFDDTRAAITQGRWIGLDGKLGEVMELPVGELGDARVARVPQGLSLVWNRHRIRDGRSFGATIVRTVVDERMQLVMPEVDLLDSSSSTDDIAEVATEKGGAWIAIKSPGFRSRRDQIHLVRIDARGAVAGTVLELSAEAGSAARPSFLRVADGTLLSWLGETEVAARPTKAMVTKLGEEARTLIPPRAVATSGTRFEGAELVSVGGRPTFVLDRGFVQPLDLSGERAGAGVRPAPEAVEMAYLAPFEGGAAMVWYVRRGESHQVRYTPMRCGP